jgi:hypothetical protein
VRSVGSVDWLNAEGVGIDAALLERVCRLDVQLLQPALPAHQVAVAQRSATRTRRERVGFSQAERNGLAEMAAKHPGLTITLERTAPDGSKITITVGGKQIANMMTNPLDEVLGCEPN